MKRHFRNTPRTTAALLAAALASTPALGQTQVQDGGAHDANQQVGSGGYNRPAEQVDYRARNLLITGNVGGGRGFQGNIDYFGEGEFHGSLGSDDLFNFRRDSIYSTPGLGGLQAQGYGDRVIVTRPTTSIPGYRVGSGYNLAARSSFDPSSGVLTFRQDTGALVSVTGINDPDRIAATTQSLGMIQTPQGLVSIDASPLTGVSYNPLDVNTGGRLIPNRTDNKPASEDLVDPRDIIPTKPLDGSIDTPGTGSDDLLNLPEDPLSVALGMQMQSAMQLSLAGRVDNNIPNDQAQQIRQQLFGRAEQLLNKADPASPTGNPYDKIVADILAQSKGEQVQPPKPEDQNPQDPQVDNRPRWQQILEQPEQAVMDTKRKSREIAIRLSLGMVDEQGNVDFEEKLPQIDPDSELGKLLKDLDYDLPRVNTFAGVDENRLNTMLTRGEQELKAGRYTIAESIYRQVLREGTEQPLANAGLVHSQMGAGMIRSAAFNLRSLFSEHPELIALRYDDKLLPDNERLQWLQGRLLKEINDNNPGADPGLILAYLGYQLDAKPLIEFGLNVAETEAPRDPLMPILRRIWLEDEDADDAAE